MAGFNIDHLIAELAKPAVSKAQHDFYKMIAYSGTDPETGLPKAPRRRKGGQIKVEPDGTVRSRVNFNPNIGHPKALRDAPTDDYGVNRRTSNGVERLGPVRVPGGGAANQVPTPDEAREALAASPPRESLPDKINSKDATRNNLRRQKIKSGRKVADPIKPDGTDEYSKQTTGKSHKYRYRRDRRVPGAPYTFLTPSQQAQDQADEREAAQAQRQQAKASTGRRRTRLKPSGKPGSILGRRRKRPPGPLSQESKYLSKTINEKFDSSLSEALGI